MLDRICVLVNYDGSLRLKGGCPDVSLMKKFCNSFYKPTTQVIKHDFLIPFNSFLGINSADQYEKTGVQIQALNNKKIFPLYGVWPPTQQHYYKLLEDFIASSRNLLATPRNIIDIGCGTGVLGLIFNQKSDNSLVYALDKNEDAVKCSRLNSQIIDVAERYNAQCFDFVSNSLEEQSKQFDQWHFPQKYDIIVSNPPWINAQPLSSQHSLDNGVYDYKEQFLINLFEFSKQRLNVIPKKSKQGRLLLLYSDLGEIMGLQEENRIQKLCSQYNLYINNQFETPLISDLEKNRKIQQKIDPLLSFKIRSKAILYEITRFQ
ncbi:hypothetical protein PPERSA_05389 [Pseudocohnilembus persalinus]|uniref:Methyltransferase small domain-containing protein n=1 Tax=Pseudocohnilembus persalinus TaxID=266149 RepID=A0A0V0R7V4_PSEPJ|nr:hypothetical protein PPERSA_05389 [Pseudocohnilembus persalinus]|eukprot:KRX10569.1 hypothetical protein PPERSA_05389 [Pseudocohnilembus persalinus]